MLREEIQSLQKKTGGKELKNFAFLIGTILLILAIYLYYKSSSLIAAVLVAAFILFLCGLLLPNVLKPLYIGWMTIAIILGFFVTRIVLALIFFFLFTPVGIILRLLKKDLLSQKIEQTTESYWVQKDEFQSDRERAEKQF